MGLRRIEQGADGTRFVQVEGGAPDVAHVSGAQESAARDIAVRALGEDDAEGAARLAVEREDLAAGPAVVVPVAQRPPIRVAVGDQPPGLLRVAGHGASVRLSPAGRL